jgi:uncharacterized membrane protein YgdD (TMEM256/DUF423 family)
VIRLWICAGAANGLIAVAMGAFSAHLLSERLSTQALGWVETGARYEMGHALALLAVAWLAGREVRHPVALGVAGWAFLLGTILFSGALYVMALTGIKALASVVPLGGVAFLIGWAALFVFGLVLKW